MKRVSLKVAKAIKEAGYPQKECAELKMRNLPERIDMPTYLDVWLWLWRENKAAIMLDLLQRNSWAQAFLWQPSSNTGISFECIDPEEAIKSAIEYLADNDLIK